MHRLSAQRVHIRGEGCKTRLQAIKTLTMSANKCKENYKHSVIIYGNLYRRWQKLEGKRTLNMRIMFSQSLFFHFFFLPRCNWETLLKSLFLAFLSSFFCSFVCVVSLSSSYTWSSTLELFFFLQFGEEEQTFLLMKKFREPFKRRESRKKREQRQR